MSGESKEFAFVLRVTVSKENKLVANKSEKDVLLFRDSIKLLLLVFSNKLSRFEHKFNSLFCEKLEFTSFAFLWPSTSLDAPTQPSLKSFEKVCFLGAPFIFFAGNCAGFSPDSKMVPFPHFSLNFKPEATGAKPRGPLFSLFSFWSVLLPNPKNRAFLIWFKFLFFRLEV